jgi:DNA-binding CsgD family transcriptional regulator
MTEHAVVIAGGGPTGLMLAGELSDREIAEELWITRRTETHLTHVFQKLGIASGTELAVSLALRPRREPAAA